MGDYLTPRWATRRRLARMLADLQAGDQFQDLARDWAGRFDPAAAMREACDQVEQTAR